MKNNTFSIFSLLLLTFFFLGSCNNSDDDGGGEESSTFISTCCQVPHLEACVGGANVYVPNAFSPNGDGFSDLFYPFGDVGVESIVSFKIFDGDDIVFEQSNFQANNPSFGWDGILPDGTMADAIYTYSISINNVAGLTEDFEGTVCVRTGDLFCVDFEDHCAYPTQHTGQGGFDPSLPTFESCE